MIPVVLSPVKNHIVHFDQENRGNPLLKVALVLEVIAKYLQPCLRTCQES